MRLTVFSIFLFGILGLINNGFAQEFAVLEGYVFQDNNSGYLNEVKIKVLDAETSLLYGEEVTNIDGYFAMKVPVDKDFIVQASKAAFDSKEAVATSKNLTGSKAYVKIAMARSPGYRLEVTLAEERTDDEQTEVDAISGSLIEVYNNTTDKEIVVLKDHPSPYFSVQLEQGNHYTLLIRTPGYFTKRIESFVNIDGCILCMDGVSEIGPGVSDNLAHGNDVGTLLANIEIKPLRVDSAIALDNIYYDYNSANLRPDATFELDKIVELLRVNPSVLVELSSHTDSRGYADYNKKLSQERAQSAVDYIVAKGIEKYRLSPKGYGEEKLVNKCFDGVNCSETEHSRNRRTELKITGFTNDPFDGKPLADIIAEEKMDALLAEVLDGGEFTVPEGTALADDLERQNAENAQAENIQTEVEEPKGISKLGAVADDAQNKLFKAKKEPLPKAVASEAVKNNTTIESQASNEVISVLVPEQSIVNAQPLTMPTGAKYTGYRVLVFQSGTSLADENGELFFKYGLLSEEELAGGSFGYMSGAFRTEIEARSYLDNVISLFPEARLLRYLNGFIIENTQ